MVGEALFWMGGAGLLVVSSLWVAFRTGQESVRHNVILERTDRDVAVADMAEHLSGEWADEDYREVTP